MHSIFNHYSDHDGEWPWENFLPVEVACRHCGELYLDHKAMTALQLLRDAWGKPIIITSGHRCQAHNAEVGGHPNSEHLKLAFDCVCPRKDQEAFVNAARIVGFTDTGFYPVRNFVHLSLAPKGAPWWVWS